MRIRRRTADTRVADCAPGILVAPPVVAQTASVQDGALQDWMRLKDTMLKIAEAMPEDRFGYRPTPPQRTFGEQILHIAEANVNQMGRFGSTVVAPAINMKATTKADILKALGDSFDFGTAALKEQTDQTMVGTATSTPFDRFMGPSTKVRVAVLRDRPHVGHLRTDGRLPSLEWDYATSQRAVLGRTTFDA